MKSTPGMLVAMPPSLIGSPVASSPVLSPHSPSAWISPAPAAPVVSPVAVSAVVSPVAAVSAVVSSVAAAVSAVVSSVAAAVSSVAAAVPAVVSAVESESSSLPQLATVMSARAAKASTGFLRRLVDGPVLMCMATPLCSMFTVNDWWCAGGELEGREMPIRARSSVHEPL